MKYFLGSPNKCPKQKTIPNPKRNYIIGGSRRGTGFGVQGLGGSGCLGLRIQGCGFSVKSSWLVGSAFGIRYTLYGYGFQCIVRIAKYSLRLKL